MRQGQRCPAPPVDELKGFPYEWLSPKRELWRATKRTLGPWWFGNSRESRFDLDPPNGTCYLAADRNGALREAIGAGVRTIPPSFIEERDLARLRVEKSRKVANTMSDKAVPYGVTRELASMIPYDCPQSWARAFAELGHGGIRYELRFSLSKESVGFALFGPRGEQPWPVEERVPINEAIINRLFIDEGIEVARIPRTDEIVVMGPDN